MEPKPLAEVAVGGDRGATLEALRDRLCRQIDETDSARDVAALSRQLTEVLTLLAKITGPAKESPLDELARRRASRGPDAEGESGAGVV